MNNIHGFGVLFGIISAKVSKLPTNAVFKLNPEMIFAAAKSYFERRSKGVNPPCEVTTQRKVIVGRRPYLYQARVGATNAKQNKGSKNTKQSNTKQNKEKQSKAKRSKVTQSETRVVRIPSKAE